MQKGIVFSHDEICDLIRYKAMSEIIDKISEDFVRVSIGFYSGRVAAVVRHIDGVSHLHLDRGKKLDVDKRFSPEEM